MMHLWRIEPKLNGTRIDTHFFECDRCGHNKSEDVSRVSPGRAC
jgi:hypothetical protein